MEPVESLLVVSYEHAVNHLTMYIEWRHKTMLRMAAVISGTLFAARWLVERDSNPPRITSAAVLLGGALLAAFTAAMEERNNELIDRCRKEIGEIEDMLVKLGGHPAITNIYKQPDGVNWLIRHRRYRLLVGLTNLIAVAGLGLLAVAALLIR